jgi:hypothetical protein
VRRIVLLCAVLFAATVAVAAAATGGLPNIGKPSMKTQPVYKGYYDHHIDTYLITDVSSKSGDGDARQLLGRTEEREGTAGAVLRARTRCERTAHDLRLRARRKDYNPLWEEVWVMWKKGVKPVLIGQDDQIDALEKQGKMTEEDAHIVLNAPILKVGKGG